jgi:hypothetical protein
MHGCVRKIVLSVVMNSSIAILASESINQKKYQALFAAKSVISKKGDNGGLIGNNLINADSIAHDKASFSNKKTILVSKIEKNVVPGASRNRAYHLAKLNQEALGSARTTQDQDSEDFYSENSYSEGSCNDSYKPDKLSQLKLRPKKPKTWLHAARMTAGRSNEDSSDDSLLPSPRITPGQSSDDEGFYSESESSSKAPCTWLGEARMTAGRSSEDSYSEYSCNSLFNIQLKAFNSNKQSQEQALAWWLGSLRMVPGKSSDDSYSEDSCEDFPKLIKSVKIKKIH